MRILSIILLSICFAGVINAQRLNTPRNYNRTTATKKTVEDDIIKVLPRDKIILENSQKDRNSVTWTRDVYRIVDVENDKNAAFFYPRESDEIQANLFSLIFNLAKDGKVNAYKFHLENKVGKQEMEQIKFRDMLDLHSIPYTMGANNSITVDGYDLPSEEIRSYYVREQWVFDERTRKGDVKIVAICPVLHRPESYEFSDSPVLRIPLFWLSFNDISHYLLRAVNHTAVSDVTKHSTNLSLFDIIRNRFYDGKIYQIGDRVLLEFYNDEQELEFEQERLDADLNRVMKRFNTIR